MVWAAQLVVLNCEHCEYRSDVTYSFADLATRIANNMPHPHMRQSACQTRNSSYML